MTIERLAEPEVSVRVTARIACSGLARILEAVAIISVVLIFQGCGDHDQMPEITKQAVKFDEVPETVRGAASKAIPDVKLDEAWKNLGSGGKLLSYEIRGKNVANGKIREVRVSLTGEILEIE